MSSVASHHLSTPLLTHLCPSSVDNRHAPARRVARTYSPMSRAHARAQPDRPGCYGRVHASVPTALVDLVENSAARTTRGCAPTTRRWPGRLASSQRELRCALGRCQVLGLSCRWLDGAVRQQCAGHLPFERQARANGSFPILPTGSTDPMLPFSLEESHRSTRVVSGRQKAQLLDGPLQPIVGQKLR